MFEIMKPFYYDLFSCTAGECKDSCCSLGWNIEIDADTYQKYQTLEGSLGEKLRNNTSEDFPHYFLQKDGRCPFYTHGGLCELHAEGKVELQSETCRNYPRFATSYNDFFDLSLTLSCPETAKTILQCSEPIRFIEECFEDEENTTMIPTEVLDTFRTVRKRCIEIMQTRTEPLWQRAYRVFVLSFSLYQWYEKGEFETFPTTPLLKITEIKPDRFETENSLNNILSLLECIETVSCMSNLLDPSFLEMKPIRTNPDFYEHYEEIHKEFNEYYKDFLYIYENYIVYYLHQNFLIGLLQEKQSLNKEIAWMAVSCILLKACAETVWYKNKQEITMEKQVDIMYTFARVFEHGMMLKESLYDCMCKLELCKPEKLASFMRSIL